MLSLNNQNTIIFIYFIYLTLNFITSFFPGEYFFPLGLLFFKMASGNFLVGKGLSIQGFDTYIQPVLEEKGYSIPDKLGNYSSIDQGGIFISMVGEGDLETILDETLIQAGKNIEKVEKELREKRVTDKQIAYRFQVSTTEWVEKEEDRVFKGIFKVIGIYQDNSTASKLFQPKAQEILLENLRKKLYETEKEFNSTLKNLGQRLSNI